MTGVFDPAVFSHLRIKQLDASNAWLIALPKMLWNHTAAYEERRKVIACLSSTFPIRRLWLSDLVTDSTPQWLPLSSGDLFDEIDGLDNGGWSLFFFTDEPSQQLPSLDSIPVDAPSAMAALRKMSAAAVVSSFVDDDEWLMSVAS